MTARTKSQEVTIPRLPRKKPGQVPFGTPDEVREFLEVYDRDSIEYLNALVRSIEDMRDALISTRFGRFSEINLADLQSHGGNLRDGDIFENNGILTIIRAGEAYAAPTSMTVSQGTIAVVTP